MNNHDGIEETENFLTTDGERSRMFEKRAPKFVLGLPNPLQTIPSVYDGHLW